MPCRDYEDDIARERVVEVSSQEDRDLIAKLRRQNDRLARIACFALTNLEAFDAEYCKALLKTDYEVKRWWKKHKKADAEFELENSKDN